MFPFVWPNGYEEQVVLEVTGLFLRALPTPQVLVLYYWVALLGENICRQARIFFIRRFRGHKIQLTE